MKQMPLCTAFLSNLCKRQAWSPFLSLIQFAVQQVVGYSFVPITPAWRTSAEQTLQTRKAYLLRMHMAIAIRIISGESRGDSMDSMKPPL